MHEANCSKLLLKTTLKSKGQILGLGSVQLPQHTVYNKSTDNSDTVMKTNAETVYVVYTKFCLTDPCLFLTFLPKF